MSTTRLFDQDAYLGEFEATVERSVCEGGMYRVLLDQTAFFPEGGGQPADEGTLDGIFVTDVQEIDGEIWHTVEAPLEPGKTVVGKLDFEKRFSNMQNHRYPNSGMGISAGVYILEDNKMDIEFAIENANLAWKNAKNTGIMSL